MKTKLWVRGVKSTSPTGILEEVFKQYGKINKVETGFPGFAFVEFEDGEEAMAAQAKLDKTMLKGIGKIHVSAATMRGYEEACRKKDEYWRSKGYNAAHQPGSRSRSRLRRRDRSRSRASSRHSGASSRSRPSRSRSGSQRARSRSKSPCRARRRSRRRSPSKSPSRDNSWAKRPRRPPKRESEDIGPSANHAEHEENDVDNEAGEDQACNEGVGFEEHQPIWIADTDRASVLCFFDAASPLDILVEGASVSDAHNPDRLPRFPRAFPDVDSDIQGNILNALGSFCGIANGEKNVAGMQGGERSLEVRQSIIVDPSDGVRLLRKTLVVNGTVCYSEDRSL